MGKKNRKSNNTDEKGANAEVVWMEDSPRNSTEAWQNAPKIVPLMMGRGIYKTSFEEKNIFCWEIQPPK